MTGLQKWSSIEGMAELAEYMEKNAKAMVFAAGTVICREGEQADAAYFLAGGEARVYQEAEGREIEITRLRPGAIFGEMALIRYDCYTLSVRAVTEVSAYRIEPGYLHEKLRETDPLIRHILQTTVDRMYEANELLLDMEKSAGGSGH